MNLKEIERRLTGNVSTYPNWINEIHKDLMLQYYKDDVDEKDINLKLSKIINQDFNDRYFPAKYQLGQSLEDRIKEEELRAKIELRDKKPEIKEIASKDVETPINKEDLKNMIEESVSNNLGTALSKGVEALSKQIEQQQHPLEEYESLDIKETAKAEKDKKAEEQARLQLNLKEEQNMIQDMIEGKPSANLSDFEFNTPPMSPTSTLYTETAGTETDLNEQQNVAKIVDSNIEYIHNTFGKGKEYSKKNYDLLRNELKNVSGDKSILIALSNYNDDNSIFITKSGNGKNISYKINGVKKELPSKTKTNSDENYKEVLKIINTLYNKGGRVLDFNDPETQKRIEEARKALPVGSKEIFKPIDTIKQAISGEGLKQKSLKWKRNRFQILKGEILAGNDNPNVVAEIKHLISELQKQGQLVKC